MTHFVSSEPFCLVRGFLLLLSGRAFKGGGLSKDLPELGGFDQRLVSKLRPWSPRRGNAQGRAVSPFRWACGGQGCFFSVTRVSKRGPALQTWPEFLRTGSCLFLCLEPAGQRLSLWTQLPCDSRLSLPLS